MSKNLFLVFNHNLTPEQEAAAKKVFAVENIIKMPPETAEIWGNIPPDYPVIDGFLAPVKDWLTQNAQENDFVLIQGDPGACYILVEFSLKNGLIPIYSTTRREAVEEIQPNGEIKLTHHFKHVHFRCYGARRR